MSGLLIERSLAHIPSLLSRLKQAIPEFLPTQIAPSAQMEPELRAVLKDNPQQKITPEGQTVPITIDHKPYEYAIRPAPNDPECKSISVMPAGSIKPSFKTQICG